MRKIIISVVAITLLGGAYYAKKHLAESKKAPKQKNEKIIKTVFIETVKNETLPINIEESGNLIAKDKVQLFSEVQGVLEITKKDFRAGVEFNKNETLLKINSDEHFATLQAQKSSLQNLIAAIMPDLQLDYPDSFSKWNSYLKNFNVDTKIQELPKSSSDKEKYFITGKNIYNSYYAIKNLEARLDKYRLTAPFKGILTEVSVTNGSLVRPGQKLGEFISQNIFELRLSVNANLVNNLKKGKKVTLFSIDKESSWQGKVARVNGKIDLVSQTVDVYIEVKGADLREGMYLQAFVAAKEIPDSYEVSRKLLVNNEAVYVLDNDKLKLVAINPVFFNENTVIVKGLTNGTQLISKPVPGAFTGMPVKVYNENVEDSNKKQVNSQI